MGKEKLEPGDEVESASRLALKLKKAINQVG